MSLHAKFTSSDQSFDSVHTIQFIRQQEKNEIYWVSNKQSWTCLSCHKFIEKWQKKISLVNFINLSSNLITKKKWNSHKNTNNWIIDQGKFNFFCVTMSNLHVFSSTKINIFQECLTIIFSDLFEQLSYANNTKIYISILFLRNVTKNFFKCSNILCTCVM